MARASTTSDVFNAVADVHRREILDVLITGEKAVGAIVTTSRCPSPRSRSTYGCSVRWDSSGAGRRVVTGCTAWHPSSLRPLHDWVAKYEQAINDRLDRMDDYLKSYNDKESGSDT